MPQLGRPPSPRQSVCSQKPREHALCERGGGGWAPRPSAGWEWGPRWPVGCRGVRAAAYGVPPHVPRGLLIYLMWMLSVQKEIMDNFLSVFCFFLHACPRAAKSLPSCPTLCDPIDGSPPAPLAMGFSRQEYWSGLTFLQQTLPSPRDKGRTQPGREEAHSCR